MSAGGESRRQQSRRGGSAGHRKARHETVHGLHAVTRALESRPDAVLDLWVSERRQDERMEAVLRLAAAAGIKVQAAEDATLTRLSDGERHQGVVAKLRARPAPEFKRLIHEEIMLYHR